MIGRLLDYRYKLIKVLGTGGFGETYIAQDTKRPGNPICVVKHLKPSQSNTKMFTTAKRLFNIEAETLEKLGNYDQVPRLLAYFVENQEFYLVQEFIEGHSLSEELIPGNCWSETQVIYLLHEILVILEVVHNHDVIHRDIKPDNIIRQDSDGKLVLVDFGAVKQLHNSHLSSRANPTGTVAIGTLGYMPTEQGQGKPRPNSDLYALGIIAIQALTGISPINLQEDPNTGEIVWQHLVSINMEFSKFLTKMVYYHFKNRYQSASEALEGLKPLCTFSGSVKPPDLSKFPVVVTRPLDSQQKTIALAPANSRQGEKALTGVTPTTTHVFYNFDLLQSSILIVLTCTSAVMAPTVMHNVQDVTANFIRGEQIDKTCFAKIIGNSNIRSEPNTINSSNIIRTVTDDTNLELTGKYTKSRWVQVKLNSGKLGWVNLGTIKNRKNWVYCLQKKGIEIKIIDDNTVINHVPGKTIDHAQFGKNKTSTRSSSISILSPTGEKANKILERAKKQYKSGDFVGAIALLKSISNNASEFQEAAEIILEWQQNWQKAESLFNDINKALDNRQWEILGDYQRNLEKLPDIKYWRNKIKPLLKKAADKMAREENPTPSKLGKKQNSINKLFEIPLPKSKTTQDNKKDSIGGNTVK
ncbi:serine/threonine kinase [Richelia intracellularis HH01]|uniref:non-specific serine/threonine protein kinase n=1 Tax=Richelia intracellularis HH01 TaxID=1165094 RepID=M1X3C9_9NOST|nr:serine/threonine protein kinase [Richelia intracellularis]CCH68355.1 serine/threonine kinase [Richelia intracellularis HH01]HAE05811.1 serine/threonine protein kinase [Richelia sp.]